MATVPLNKQDPERYYAVMDRLSEGATVSSVMKEFKIDYYTVQKYFANAGRPDLARGVTLDKSDPEKYKLIGGMVASGASLNEILRTTGTDSRTVKKYFPNAGRPDLAGGKKLTLPETDPERYKEIGRLVMGGASINEIMRSTGTDHRTIKKYFPKAGWEHGGGGKAAEAREANRKLKDLDGHGMVKKNRDAGFNLRGGR